MFSHQIMTKKLGLPQHKVNKKRVAKPRRYDNPSKYWEGNKLFIRGKVSLQKSSTEIFLEIKEKEANKRKLKEDIKTIHDVRKGNQTQITNMFNKK